MMRAAIIFGVLLLIVLFVLGYLAWHARRRSLWDTAESDAKWESFVGFRDGQQSVGVRRVAKVGKRRKVLETQETMCFNATASTFEVEQARWDAAQLAEQLNT